jgi:hypothetical protein
MGYAGSGTQTAALAIGGIMVVQLQNISEEYDGSSLDSRRNFKYCKRNNLSWNRFTQTCCISFWWISTTLVLMTVTTTENMMELLGQHKSASLGTARRYI